LSSEGVVGIDNTSEPRRRRRSIEVVMALYGDGRVLEGRHFMMEEKRWV